MDFHDLRSRFQATTHAGVKTKHMRALTVLGAPPPPPPASTQASHVLSGQIFGARTFQGGGGVNAQLSFACFET